MMLLNYLVIVKRNIVTAAPALRRSAGHVGFEHARESRDRN